MSTAPPRMTEILPLAKGNTGRLLLFSGRIRTVWLVVALLTVAPELLPTRPMLPPIFYTYYALKVICFFMLGFLAPLAIRSLNQIGIGMILAFSSAFLIETCQGLLRNGHVFHWYELAGKLSLIALGFALALDCRYERKVSLWRLHINLSTDH